MFPVRPPRSQSGGPPGFRQFLVVSFVGSLLSLRSGSVVPPPSQTPSAPAPEQINSCPEPRPAHSCPELDPSGTQRVLESRCAVCMTEFGTRFPGSVLVLPEIVSSLPLTQHQMLLLLLTADPAHASGTFSPDDLSDLPRPEALAVCQRATKTPCRPDGQRFLSGGAATVNPPPLERDTLFPPSPQAAPSRLPSAVSSAVEELLPCGHGGAFCRECLLLALGGDAPRTSCPLCRADCQGGSGARREWETLRETVVDFNLAVAADGRSRPTTLAAAGKRFLGALVRRACEQTVILSGESAAGSLAGPPTSAQTTGRRGFRHLRLRDLPLPLQSSIERRNELFKHPLSEWYQGERLALLIEQRLKTLRAAIRRGGDEWETMSSYPSSASE